MDLGKAHVLADTAGQYDENQRNTHVRIQYAGSTQQVSRHKAHLTAMDWSWVSRSRSWKTYCALRRPHHPARINHLQARLNAAVVAFKLSSRVVLLRD